ncbi:unnamed protein product [Microthlaspi erraticum]|uniref:Uncharacterized protein n=1 Tax=Microthlaspi erraticum TaxID=1685480 RepID=A0A6D2K5K7_9BRAS|nr:unnamed protein product [Microthlaspi erraticum]
MWDKLKIISSHVSKLYSEKIPPGSLCSARKDGSTIFGDWSSPEDPLDCIVQRGSPKVLKSSFVLGSRSEGRPHRHCFHITFGNIEFPLDEQV